MSGSSAVSQPAHSAVSLKLEEYKGKQVTAHERMLLEIFEHIGTCKMEKPASTKAAALDRNRAKDGPTSGTAKTLSNRERVQQFLAKKQTSGKITPTGSGLVKKPALSAVDKVKAVMSRSSGSAMSYGPSSSPHGSQGPGSLSGHGSKRTNPLAQILGTAGSGMKRPLQGNTAIGTLNSNKRSRMVMADNNAELQLPAESFLRVEQWSSMEDRPLIIGLPCASFSVNNTLILRVTMPSGSQRCCVNLIGSDGINFENPADLSIPEDPTILFHFNPRNQNHKIQIIQNSKIESIWGIIEVLHRSPIKIGTPFNLRITLTTRGFAFFINETFQGEFPHRKDFVEGENLVLNVPTRDDNGNQEGVIIHNVWWGHADPSVTNVAHNNSASGGSFEKRRSYPSYDAYVGGLTQDIGKHDIEDLFQNLQFDQVRIMTGKGFGFVSFRSMKEVDEAIRELNGSMVKGVTIKVSRARGLHSNGPGARRPRNNWNSNDQPPPSLQY